MAEKRHPYRSACNEKNCVDARPYPLDRTASLSLKSFGAILVPRTTPHRQPPLPTSHIPAEPPFQRVKPPSQRVAIDLADDKTVSQGCKCVLSVVDHLTRFVDGKTKNDIPTILSSPPLA